MKYQRRMHPTLDLLVDSVGCVYLPASGSHKPHATFGCDDGKGYREIVFANKKYKVHRLVAETFIPNSDNKPFIDHINRCRSDNRVENLRWCTPSENMRNTPQHDIVDTRDGIHYYTDAHSYWKARDLRRRAEHPEKLREKDARYAETHKRLMFSDGKRHWVANENAVALLSLPVRKRSWGGTMA